ncbi:MAG: hypothetical protein AB1656_06820 [Candidatus Omnitrophota bacterium]
MMKPLFLFVLFGGLLLALAEKCWSQKNSLGLFEASNDIGQARHPGAAQFDPAKDEYTIAGGGENMWFDKDAFHFAWKKISGDFTLSADIRFLGQGGNAHRKACLLIRQTLDADSAYVDAALHGDGLTSLQYREESGALTREIQSNCTAPRTLAITRRGDAVFMSVAREGEETAPAGGSFKIRFADPVYVGLGVCAHDDNRLERAVFSNVSLIQNNPGTDPPVLESTLETISIASKDRRVVYRSYDWFEAPNWTPDGQYLVFNRQGKIFKIPAQGGEPAEIDTGFANRCNNDHGVSPDGKQLVISDQSQEKKSLIYILPFEGGVPRRITSLGPSYWHGWSPDGETLTYCAERNGEYDIYSISVQGGEEKRLTHAPGLDDGPDFSPDGQYIYFNSERSGCMQIWRMKKNGSDPEPITFDENNNWFPHPSPDGKWIVFLTYNKEVKGHPANQDVMLRLMPIGGKEIQVLAKLFGGQGTINVPSWSPDSRHVAFVSYRLEYK